MNAVNHIKKIADGESSSLAPTGRFIQAFVFFYVVITGLMHFLQPEQSPVAIPMSAYVLGSGGYLMTLSFFILSMTLVTVWLGLKDQLPGSWKSYAGTVFILLAAVATAVAGIFPDDGLQPPLLPVSTTGWVHLVAGMIAFPSFLLGPLFLSLSLRQHPDWRSRTPALLTVIIFLLLSVIWFATWAAPNNMAGLAQRILLTLLLVWLLIVADRLNFLRQLQKAE